MYFDFADAVEQADIGPACRVTGLQSVKDETLQMNELALMPNPDLEVIDGHMSRWNHADNRRHGFHNLHKIVKYCSSIRSAEILKLEKRMDLRLADVESVRHFTSLPWFSAMVVIKGQEILFERYAPDFRVDSPHSIQSITKTIVNLIIGQLVESKSLDLTAQVASYLPEIGSGYAQATIQQVLNMDVVNDYTEDFTDPRATYFEHEVAMGWRLTMGRNQDESEHSFLPRIRSEDVRNRSGHTHYKDSNTAVLGWIAERASGRRLNDFLIDIVNAAGLEHIFYMTTDRAGVPNLEGGACLTARDLARYFSIFARGGTGIGGQRIVSRAFMDTTLRSGVPMTAPYEGIRYSNHVMVREECLGHGGWGGQYALLNVRTGTVAVFFSVLENEHAINRDYLRPVINMLETVVSI